MHEHARPNENNPQPASRWSEFQRLAQRTGATLGQALRLASHTVRHVQSLVVALDRDGRQVVADATALWAALSQAAHEAEKAFAATPRIAGLFKEMARLAAVYRMHYLRIGFLPEAAEAGLTEALHRRESARIRAFCETMGGGLLKVGQLVSARSDLLPPIWVETLGTLQDRAPASPPEAIAALLAASAPHPDLDPISFELEPIAAASIAQVHRGTHHDGRALALKVRRPGIEVIIDQDRRALLLLADVFANLVPTFDIGPFLSEIAKSLGEELDFRDEADFAQAFKAAVGHRVVIPEVHAPFAEDLLVMDFIAAERLPDALAAASLAARNHLLETLARTLAEAILVHGLVHADPHPGNFLAIPDTNGDRPQLVMLDFGAALRLSEAERRAYLLLLPALLGKNEAAAANLLTELGFSAPDPAAPARFAIAIIGSLLPQSLADIDPKRELERGLALARQYPGLVVPPHFVRISRAFAAISGLFITWRPELDLGRLLMETLLLANRPTS